MSLDLAVNWKAGVASGVSSSTSNTRRTSVNCSEAERGGHQYDQVQAKASLFRKPRSQTDIEVAVQQNVSGGVGAGRCPIAAALLAICSHALFYDPDSAREIQYLELLYILDILLLETEPGAANSC